MWHVDIEPHQNDPDFLYVRISDGTFHGEVRLTPDMLQAIIAAGSHYLANMNKPEPHTKEDNIEFRKEWDRRYEEGKRGQEAGD